jgi:hypothetical protein
MVKWAQSSTTFSIITRDSARRLNLELQLVHDTIDDTQRIGQVIKHARIYAVDIKKSQFAPDVV